MPSTVLPEKEERPRTVCKKYFEIRPSLYPRTVRRGSASVVTADASFQGFVLAIVANEIAGQPASASLTYGPVRAEVLSALFSTVFLLVLSFLLVYSAFFRIYGEFPLFFLYLNTRNFFCGRSCIVKAHFAWRVGGEDRFPLWLCAEATLRNLLHIIVPLGC